MSRKYGIHSCRLCCATVRILCCSAVTTARTCNRAGCRSATKQPFSRGKYPTANLWHALYSSSSRTGVLWIRIADFWTRSLPASRFSLGEQSDPPTHGTSSWRQLATRGSTTLPATQGTVFSFLSRKAANLAQESTDAQVSGTVTKYTSKGITKCSK